MITGHPLEKIINGPAHHTLHHLYFTCNYGQVTSFPIYTNPLNSPLFSFPQYFTWADRAGGSYRHPAKELDPMLEIQMMDKEKKSKSE
jgi:Delta7-sterol 5-desaturase